MNIKIEIADGDHPFSEASGFLGLIKCIVSVDPPKLDADRFSPELCEFVDKWLILLFYVSIRIKLNGV